MGKYFVYVLGTVLIFAPQLRANITVTNGSAAFFADAVSNTIAAGGGTILVTSPIMIGSNGVPDTQTFDGQSKVTVSGGNASSLFTVVSGSLTLANMKLVNGFHPRLGGAMYIATNGLVMLTNCTFASNSVHGADGVSADSNTNSSSGGNAGKNGGRGTAGNPAYGGAIFNWGNLTLFNCIFLTNSAVGGSGGDGADGQDAGIRGGNGGSGGAAGSAVGGGVANYGTLVVSNCTFSGNLAQGGTGGIGGVGGAAVIPGATGFAGAAGSGGGAGLYTSNTNIVFNSTFDHNLARGGDSQVGGTYVSGTGQNAPRGGDAFGGGIENFGWLSVTNSTFFQNSALGGTGGDGGEGGIRGGNGGTGGNAVGGGIYNASFITVVNCTFSKGSAVGGTNGAPGGGAVFGRNGKRGSSFGGNIANVAKKKKGGFQLFNSIIAAALSGGSAYGTVSNGGYNIIADKSIKFKKGTSLSNTNPLVGDLGDNGGPTETVPLQTNSPAIDRIPFGLAPLIDQRGFSRNTGTNADIGAYEIDLDRATIINSPQSTNTILGSNVTFTVTAGGTGPFFYQWIFTQNTTSNTVTLIDATNSVLSITNVQFTNAGSYQVIVTNNFNSVTSKVAVLTVNSITNSAPGITQQPVVRQDVVAGITVTISVTATGTIPLFYQWIYENNVTLNTVPLTGATNSVLSLINVQTTNTGFYAVIITNNFGAVTSSVSTLVVTNGSGNINPAGFLRIKGAPASAIQMVSAPRTSKKNASSILKADIEAAINESLRGRARHSVRAEPDFIQWSNAWPDARLLSRNRPVIVS